MIDLNELTPFELDEPETRSNDVRKKAMAIRRAKRLARPITTKQIAHFEKYLRPIYCGCYECCIHVGKNIVKGKDGRGTYVRVWHNSELVLAHRLAFCMATGTPFADIQDYQISHTNTCVGYRCVRPDHLFKGAKKYRDHGNIAQPWLFPECLEHGGPAHDGHHKIEQNKVRALLLGAFQPLPSVARRNHLVTGIGQYGLEHLCDAELVVNDQDERHASPSPLSRAFS